jgi:glycine oxidase
LQKVDYIIVGQGIAGSAVAVQLLRRGRKILVIDLPSENSSSRIAAGLFNPITGKKMVKTWLADKLFPALHDFYTAVEEYTGSKFFFPTDLYRPFLSIEELNEWMARSAEPGYEPYIGKVHGVSVYNDIKDPFGGLRLRQCGYLDTKRYIQAVGDWIRQKDILLQARFDFESLHIHESGITYHEYAAEKIIFCQGVQNNPWFNWLPIRPLKGETLSIASAFSEKVVINRGVYILPADDQKLQRVGSTYHFQDRLEQITSEAREELLKKLGDLIAYPFQIKDQQWGWRPTTPDRRPLLGKHPESDSIVIFNGLGTKGVSLAPYFSDVLIHWIENQVPLDKEVDIERYKSVYWIPLK